MIYISIGAVSLFVWSILGITLGLLWIGSEEPVGFFKEKSNREYFRRMSGRYVSIMGGPIVWLILICSRASSKKHMKEPDLYKK
jgi:hypothetical protein